MRLKVTKADKLFSLIIRHRDDFTCQRCHTQYEFSDNQLDCSHFHSRSKKSVRFDKDNCVTLCKKCHLYFDGNTWLKLPPHKEEHRAFMLKRLGKERLDALDLREELPKWYHQKIDENSLAIGFAIELEEFQKKRMESKFFK